MGLKKWFSLFFFFFLFVSLLIFFFLTCLIIFLQFFTSLMNHYYHHFHPVGGIFIIFLNPPWWIILCNSSTSPNLSQDIRKGTYHLISRGLYGVVIMTFVSNHLLCSFVFFSFFPYLGGILTLFSFLSFFFLPPC